MEKFNTIEELNKKYITLKDLIEIIRANGFPSTALTIRRWEKLGIIPIPRRVIVNRNEWRAYSKEDVEAIIENLRKRVTFRIRNK